MKSPSKLEIAKTQIVLSHPFFASILLRRKMVLTESVPTMAVSNIGTIYLNPKFIEQLSVRQVIWGLCHETMHVVLSHAVRLNGRVHTKWNYAGDAVINDVLTQSRVGDPIPNTVSMPGSRDKTTDQVYNSLPDDPPDDGRGQGQGQSQEQGQGQGQSQGQGSPKRDGSWMDGDALGQDVFEETPMSEAEAQAAEAQIRVEVAQAAQAAKMRGQLPAALAKFVNDIIASHVPWFDVLERMMQAYTQTDYSWRRPNRRFTDYLPSTGRIPRMGKVVIVSDISGSVSRKENEHFGGHLSRIIADCNPEEVHILYTDTRVQKHEEFGPDDEVKLSYTSGGGTDMTAAFRYIDKNDIEPEVCIILTDGETPFGEAQPYPVIWCASQPCQPTHGELIRFSVES